MSLSVLGLGLVSPLGKTAREHVFFPPANAPPPAPAAFVLADRSPFWVNHVRFVLPLDLGERLFALALVALEEAKPEPQSPLFLILPEPREGLDHNALQALAGRLRVAARASSVECFHGAAGAFQALARILVLVARGELTLATLLGVDSFFHTEAAETFVQCAPSPFSPLPLPPSEAAAAIVVAIPKERARLLRPSLGEIRESQVALGRGRDDDDEPADALALTSLLRSMKTNGPIRGVFGQGQVDSLRSRDWEWAAARNDALFHAEAFSSCLEADIGRLGAAAGIASLAHAIATFRHQELPPQSRFLAWAISRDGLRGVVCGVGAETTPANIQKPLSKGLKPFREPGLVAPITPFSSTTAGDDVVFDEASFDEAALLAPENDISILLPSLSLEAKPPPLAKLDTSRLRPLSLDGFSSEVVTFCAETLLALGKNRENAPGRTVLDSERRIRAALDAIVATGPRSLVDLAGFWVEMQKNPWSAWAGTLTALVLDGNESLELIDNAIDAFPDDALLHAKRTAEALVLSERPDLFAFGRALTLSKREQKRAVGLLFLAQRQALSITEIHDLLVDPSPIVREAALLACSYLPASALHVAAPLLRDLVHTETNASGLIAARLLAVHGDMEIRRILKDGSLASRAPHIAAEIFLLMPQATDASQIDDFFRNQTPSAALLSAAARWGRKAVIPRLLQSLSNDDFAQAAAAGLLVMLGPSAAPKDVFSAGAWRHRMDAMQIDPQLRLRRGFPHSPQIIADECSSGELTRAELSLRIDELRAMLGYPSPILLSGWWEDTESGLAPLMAAARKGKA